MTQLMNQQTVQVQKQITDASSLNYWVSTYQSYHQTIITALQLQVVPNSYDLTTNKQKTHFQADMISHAAKLS